MAITNTKTDSGITTVFDGTGASQELSGRQLVFHAVFGGAVASVQPEIWVGGAWTPMIGTPISADENFNSPTNKLRRDYRFRFNCTAFTSGTPTIHWDVGQ